MNNSKKIELTPQEIDMIREDIESTKDYFEAMLETESFETDKEKEEFLDLLNISDNILKKL